MADIVQLFTADEAVSRANFNQRLTDINTKTALGDASGKALEALKLSGIEVLTSDKTIYVRKTGNDETGDGSTEKPFLTIGKALSYVRTLSGAYGISIRIGNGIYDEGYKEISHNVRSLVLIAENATGQDVTIRSTGGVFQVKSNTEFNNIKFEATLNNDVIITSISTTVGFFNCKFSRTGGTGNGDAIGTNTKSLCTADSCEFNNFSRVFNISWASSLTAYGLTGQNNSLLFLANASTITYGNASNIGYSTLKSEIVGGLVRP